MTTQETTRRQRKMIQAIDAGQTTIRELMDVAGINSTSVVKHNLEQMAARGEIALETLPNSGSQRPFSGRDFCAAWDSAARLAGNPEA